MERSFWIVSKWERPLWETRLKQEQGTVEISRGVKMKFFWAIVFMAIAAHAGPAEKPKALPTIPLSGIEGSVGAGFTDFTIVNPSTNFKMDRGTYVAIQIERGFEVLNLYFTMTLSQMNAQGTANYTYSNLSSSNKYSVKDVDFDASLLDLALGFKLKLIDGYWFRPYVEGGGIGSYYQITYKSKFDLLDAQGADWKKNDVLMGSGYYGEAGIEVQFSDHFGAKFSARYSEQQSKDLATQGNEKLKFRGETYYFSALMNF
jgi:hypothetical protein